MKQLLLLFALVVSVSAQFSRGTGSSTPVDTAIEWGKSQNSKSVLKNLGFSTRDERKSEAMVSSLHGKFFNLAARDKKLEKQVFDFLTPVLQQLDAADQISVLVISDDHIPYARLTPDGIFIMSSVLAKGDFTGLKYHKGFFLRELIRLSLISEYGQAVAQGDANALQTVDLKITAGATILGKGIGIAGKEIRGAVIQYATRVQGTASTAMTDSKLYPGRFIAQTAQTGKVNRFIAFPSRVMQTETFGRYDQLHLRSANIASTEDHTKVIAYFQ